MFLWNQQDAFDAYAKKAGVLGCGVERHGRKGMGQRQFQVMSRPGRFREIQVQTVVVGLGIRRVNKRMTVVSHVHVLLVFRACNDIKKKNDVKRLLS